jgi:hypothetical protein
VDTARRYTLTSNLLGVLGLLGLAVATAELAGPWWGLAGASAAAVGVAYALNLSATRIELASRRRPLNEPRRPA